VTQQRSNSEESNLHHLGSILRGYASLSYNGTQQKLQNLPTDGPNQTMFPTRLFEVRLSRFTFHFDETVVLLFRDPTES
jgi:hypothetical protein